MSKIYVKEQNFKYQTIVDEYTRECLAIDVAGLIRSRRVIEELSQLFIVHRAPRYLGNNNHPGSCIGQSSTGY